MPLFVDALKEYNKSETKWTIPKRGTEEYNKVMKIMNDLKKNKTTEPKQPKQPKATNQPKE